MIALAKTAQLCSKQPSDLVGIADREIAFAFNVECADILNQWEMEREVEREKRQYQTLSGQLITSMFGGSPTENNKVDRW